MNNQEQKAIESWTETIRDAIKSKDNVGLDIIGQDIIHAARNERRLNNRILKRSNMGSWLILYGALLHLRQEFDQLFLNLPYQIDIAMGVLDYSTTGCVQENA